MRSVLEASDVSAMWKVLTKDVNAVVEPSFSEQLNRIILDQNLHSNDKRNDERYGKLSAVMGLENMRRTEWVFSISKGLPKPKGSDESESDSQRGDDHNICALFICCVDNA